MRVCACSECTGAWLSSYLAGGDELERPEGGLHVRDVGLELVERSRDAGLDLRGLGPRGAVGRDLVEGLLRHDGRLRYRYPGRRRAVVNLRGACITFIFPTRDRSACLGALVVGLSPFRGGARGTSLL